VNNDDPPPAFIVYGGLEPSRFTNIFPVWEQDETITRLAMVVRACNVVVWRQLCSFGPQTHTHTQPFYSSLGPCPGQPGWAGTRRYISPSSGFSGAKRR